jgi:hypothetical protein
MPISEQILTELRSIDEELARTGDTDKAFVRYRILSEKFIGSLKKSSQAA